MDNFLVVLLFFGLPPLLCMLFLVYAIINWGEDDFKLFDNGKPWTGVRVLILMFSTLWAGTLMGLLKFIGWLEPLSDFLAQYNLQSLDIFLLTIPAFIIYEQLLLLFLKIYQRIKTDLFSSVIS